MADQNGTLESPAEPRIIDVGGIEYTETPCTSCGETGRRYDPTLEGNIHTGGSGDVRCSRCDGAGMVRKITRRGMEQERARWDARRAAQQAEG